MASQPMKGVQFGLQKGGGGGGGGWGLASSQAVTSQGRSAIEDRLRNISTAHLLRLCS